MNAVRVARLTRRFRTGRRWGAEGWCDALADVSFAVAPGAVCAILGQNGAGKTTLLEILATLLLPHGGHAFIRDVDVAAHASRVRRLMAYVSAGGTGFFPRLTGRQNLDYFAALYDLPRHEWRPVAESATRALGIADALDRRVDHYSDGMRQRLALARAWLSGAPVWMLDEPTRGLDPAARHHTQQLLLARAREHGTTILLSTHDFEEAASISDQVIVMHRGRVVLDQPTATLRQQPGALAAAYGVVTQEMAP